MTLLFDDTIACCDDAGQAAPLQVAGFLGGVAKCGGPDSPNA